MTTTSGASRLFTVASGGQHVMNNCFAAYNISNAAGTGAEINVGALNVTQTAIQYTHTGTGGADHTMVSVGATAAVLASGVRLLGSIASDDDFYGYTVASVLTGEAATSNVQLSMEVTATNYSSNVYGVYHTGSATGLHFLLAFCTYRATGGGTITGEARHVTVTGTGTIRGTGNAVEMTGFAENYFSDVAVNGTFISHFDDADAPSGVTGAGETYYVSSFEDGQLRVSDRLDAGDVEAGNYLEIDQDGTITLFGNARQTGTLSQKVPVLRRGTCDLATVAGVRNLAFDDTTDENGTFSFLVPEDMDLTVNPLIRIFVVPREDQSSGSDMTFNITGIKYLSFGESWDKVDDETNLSQTVTVNNTKRIASACDITLDASLMTNLDGILGTFERDASNVSDDRNGDALVPEVNFVYTKNKII